MNICIFGDSIAWGAYDIEQGGWAMRLRNYFVVQNNDADVYNLSISGDTSTRLLKRIEEEAKLHKANMIIIATGINDAVFLRSTKKLRLPIDEFQQNLVKLLSIARKFTDKVIFVGLTRVDEPKATPAAWNVNISYMNKDICQFDNAIEKFCAKNKLKFISMRNVISNSGLADGVHPNTTGHIKMFEKVKTEIEPLI